MIYTPNLNDNGTFAVRNRTLKGILVDIERDNNALVLHIQNHYTNCLSFMIIPSNETHMLRFYPDLEQSNPRVEPIDHLDIDALRHNKFGAPKPHIFVAVATSKDNGTESGTCAVALNIKPMNGTANQEFVVKKSFTGYNPGALATLEVLADIVKQLPKDASYVVYLPNELNFYNPDVMNNPKNVEVLYRLCEIVEHSTSFSTKFFEEYEVPEGTPYDDIYFGPHMIAQKMADEAVGDHDWIETKTS